MSEHASERDDGRRPYQGRTGHPGRSSRPPREGRAPEGAGREGRERRGGGRQDRGGYQGRERREDGDRRPYRGSGGSERRQSDHRSREDDRRSGSFRPRQDRAPEPHLPEDVTPAALDRQVRASLRTLSKPNAEAVARHLVMSGRLQYEDPELAYQHAQAAVRRAGRVAFVREAAALTAYSTGRYAEALREIRTVRRLSGVDAHRAIEADCERGLGRPERALALAQEVTPQEIGGRQWVELCLVAAGARADMGQHEAGLVNLDGPILSRVAEPDLRHRIDSVRADLLDALGRTEEAAALRVASPAPPADDADEADEVVVFDLLEEFGVEPPAETVPASDTRASDIPTSDIPASDTPASDAPASEGPDTSRPAPSADDGDGRSWTESEDQPATGTDQEERP